MDKPDPTLRTPPALGAERPITRSGSALPFRIAGAALLLIALARIGVAEILPYAIVNPPRNLQESVLKGHDREVISNATQIVELPNRTLRIAYLHYKPDSVGGNGRRRGTIFLLHGHGDRKESQVPIARAITRRGYEVFIPDLPAHGDSEGEQVTFGPIEGMVISCLIDSLLPLSDQQKTVITWGHSLGGATAIQAAARNRQVDAVVSVSAFSSLQDVVPDYFREFFPFYPLLISEEGINWAITEAGQIADFSADAASTTAAARRLDVPLFVVHGEKDGRMPDEHARRIVGATSGKARLMLIPEAGHTDIYQTVGSDSLVGTILDWIESNTPMLQRPAV